MELLVRGKWIFGNSKSIREMVDALEDSINLLNSIPGDVEIINEGHDYIFIHAEPKDKDDRKYLKRLGFQRERTPEQRVRFPK